MILFLLRSDPLVPEFPPFMLDVREVVDYLVESPKCVGTRIEHKMAAPAQNCRNRTVQFGKPDDLILSGPKAIRGTGGHH
jgi:hypothetical protein